MRIVTDIVKSHKKSVHRILSVLVLLTGVLASCSRPTAPKPHAYYRIDIPLPSYREVSYGPYAFAISNIAEIHPRIEPGERYWMDIVYPTLNTTIHCSYKPILGTHRTTDGRRMNAPEQTLTALTADALEFVYKHAQKASAIPEQAYQNPDARVYGVYFELHGNTASPCQFFLTDSTSHFFRGAVYSNCRPNADSLAPVYQYIEQDVRVLMESFRWTK